MTNSSDHININRLETVHDNKGGVFTSKPVYNYDSVKNANLAEQVSEAAFMTYQSGSRFTPASYTNQMSKSKPSLMQHRERRVSNLLMRNRPQTGNIRNKSGMLHGSRNFRVE